MPKNETIHLLNVSSLPSIIFPSNTSFFLLVRVTLALLGVLVQFNVASVCVCVCVIISHFHITRFGSSKCLMGDNPLKHARTYSLFLTTMATRMTSNGF